MTSGLPTKVEWLLREGETERGLATGERVLVQDEYWRMETLRVDLDHSMRVFLTKANTFRKLSLTAGQDIAGEWLAGNVAVTGAVDLRASDGPEASIDATRSVIYRTFDRLPKYSPHRGPLKLAGYMIRVDRVARIFDGRPPVRVRPFVRRRLDHTRLLETPATASIRRLANALFASRLNGPLRAIFMEGVVLQLFALQAEGVLEADRHVARPQPSGALLSAAGRAAVEAARDRLLSNMRSPPTIGELAAEAGVSEKMLNAGFRALYGASAFELFRNERLEHARQILEAEVLPLKSVAFRVGYNHVSNFISAFTRRYGAPPRQYLRRAPAGAGHGRQTSHCACPCR